MTRSVLLTRRMMSRRYPSIINGNRRLGEKLHSQNGPNSDSREFASALWIGAAGMGALVLQNRTLAEGRKTDEDDNNNYNGEKREEGTPWYRRYPTLKLEQLKSATRFSKNDGDDPPPPEEKKDNETMFCGQCLQRQLYQPPVPYPAWDYNWDGKMLDGFSTLEVLSTAKGLYQSHRTGTTRHILLVRHGQYEEDHLDDHKRCLTPLGRSQAQLTGKRMAAIIEGIGAEKVTAIYTSDMLRAKQTAWIMAKSMPYSIPIQKPDPDLNEALPAAIIPPRPDLPGIMEEVDENKERMERAFAKYIHRSDPPPELTRALHQQLDKLESQVNNVGRSATGASKEHNKTLPKLPPPKHEFDIIVCHGNLIRYFACRALQLPPEAWLRLSVFNCSITYLIIKPNGYVTCRTIGDIGHLGYKETTFSGAHGLVWS